MSMGADQPRTWMRGFQLVLSLLAAAAILALVAWIAVSAYYLVQAGQGRTGLTVGAWLPNAHLLGLEADVPGLRPGTSLRTGQELPIAVHDPTPAEYGLAVSQHLPTLAVYAAFFVLLLRWLRSAERLGPFRAEHARRVRRLGAFLLAGTLTAALVEAVAQGLLARLVLVDGRFLFHFDLPTGAIVGGIGLMAVAEILRRGEQLREEVEGTV